jgi:hypothetical protein
MKIHQSLLAAILIGTLAGSAFANDAAPAALEAATAQAPAAEPAATENLEQKIAEMQQSIDKLKSGYSNHPEPHAMSCRPSWTSQTKMWRRK